MVLLVAKVEEELEAAVKTERYVTEVVTEVQATLKDTREVHYNAMQCRDHDPCTNSTQV